MKITNFKVYDIAESIVASGFPMLDQYRNIDYEDAVEELTGIFENPKKLEKNQHWQRACALCKTSIGSGHDNFLSGILISANVTATVKWWTQFQRYHFSQIVSSMSTMHRLRSMIQKCSFTYTNEEDGFMDMLESFESVLHRADNNTVSDSELAYRCPMGLELTARITTNYRQLKTIYMQRRNHKLPEWGVFCSWIEKLPFASEFIFSDYHTENEEYQKAEIHDRDKKIAELNKLISSYEDKIDSLTQQIRSNESKFKKLNDTLSEKVEMQLKKIMSSAMACSKMKVKKK